MRRLPQFVRLRLASASVSRRSSCLASCASRVGRPVSRLVRLRLASVRLVRLCLASVSRLPQFVRLRLASASRVGRPVSRLVRLASVVLSRVLCVCVSRLCVLCVCVSRLSRVCVLCVCVRLRLASVSRVCLASASCASVCVCVSRLCLASVSPCECLRRLAHFMSVVIQRV